MFTSIEISLVRERNERLLQEINADRTGRRLDREPRTRRRTARGFRPRRGALGDTDLDSFANCERFVR